MREHPSTKTAAAPASASTAVRATALAEQLSRHRPGEKKRATRRTANAGRELRRPMPFSEAEARAVEVSLERRVRAHITSGELRVTMTDNRYTMISVRRETGARYHVRLHHMFADASPVITRALARYISRNDSRASRVLGEFIDANQDKVRPRNRRPGPTIVTTGEHHDLRDIYDEVNLYYFQGTIEATITWGQRTGRPRRRNSIKMGSYSMEDRLIRIHRSLDRAVVPRFFVAWIVYHEMLHQVHDAPIVNGRRQFHTRAFLEDEAKFEQYNEAKAWERANLDLLLTY